MAEDAEGGKPKFKRFEEFVASIQKEISPDAKVTHNDKIVGTSGVARQIDISIRATVGQFHLLTVIDCKDWKTAVDIQDVEKFIGAVEDVKANKGAIVANNGFTAAAKVKAEQKGIGLYSAVDAQNKEWPFLMAITTLCDFRSPRRFSFQFRHVDPTPFEMPSVDPFKLIIHNKDEKELGTPYTLLVKAWNEKRLPTEPGQYEGLEVAEEPPFTKSRGIRFGPFQLTANLFVEQRLFLGNVKLEEGRGFYDVIKGGFTTRGILTEKLDWETVAKTWKRIEKESDLAVQPGLRIEALDYLNPDAFK